jgi:hypothetical protein
MITSRRPEDEQRAGLTAIGDNILGNLSNARNRDLNVDEDYYFVYP